MRIVVVEDETPIREGMSNILKKINDSYEVAGIAENGLQGLEIIENTEPDLIIMDIRMPDMDGIEMLTKLRERGIKSRAVILSAYSDFTYAKAAIELGIENYLLKPIKIPELKRVLKEIEKDIDAEHENDLFFSLENIFWGNITGQYTADERINDILEKQYNISVTDEFYLFQVKIRKEYDICKSVIKSLLEETSVFNHTFQSCILEFPERTATIMVMYKMSDKAALAEYFQKRVIPVICSQIKGRVIFVWKECKGLPSIHPGVLEMRKELEWCLLFGRGALISEQLIAQTQTLPLKYPIELETNAKQAIVHNNRKEFEVCAGKLQEYCKAKPHTPQEIKEVCIRYGIALFHAAKESGKLAGDLSANNIMNTVTQAITWGEIEEAFGQFFSNVLFEKEESTSTMVHRAKQLIREYYNQGITLEEIARKLCVSEEYLSTQFKKETGKTFSETIKGYRIKKVKELLLKSSLKLNQISDLAGYADPKYMSKVFKDAVGMSPAEYRKLNN